MNKKSLCEIFGIRYEDTFYDVVVCQNHRVEYKNAKKLIEETYRFSESPYIFIDTSLRLEKTDRDGTKVITEFIDISTPKSLRGRTFRMAYIEQGLLETEVVQSYIVPTTRNMKQIT